MPADGPLRPFLINSITGNKAEQSSRAHHNRIHHVALPIVGRSSNHRAPDSKRMGEKQTVKRPDSKQMDEKQTVKCPDSEQVDGKQIINTITRILIMAVRDDAHTCGPKVKRSPAYTLSASREPQDILPILGKFLHSSFVRSVRHL
jgi:hypothetical protein